MIALIAKARKALRSAEVLLELGDTSGAANRIYYAVFDAMRASIQHLAGIDLNDVKTHHGIFRMFERHVLSPGLMAAEDARIIYRAQELRWSGDYAISIELDAAQVARAIRPASAFVETCARLVKAGEEER